MTEHDYTWWATALVNPSQIGKELPLHANVIHAGYYRRKFEKDGPWRPVAFFKHEGVTGPVECIIDGTESVPPDSMWLAAAVNPVSEDDYYAVVWDGKPWADEIPIIKNTPKEETELDRIQREIDDTWETARDLMKAPISGQSTADKIAKLIKTFGELYKDADKAREVEKAPILKAGKDIDDRWRIPKDNADKHKADLKSYLKPWMDELDRQEKVRQAAAFAEANRLRQEAAKTQNAEQADKLAAEAQEAAKSSIAQTVKSGKTGSSVGFVTVKSAEITDFNLLLGALSDRDEIKELVQKLANQNARNGITLAGMKIVETRELRG